MDVVIIFFTIIFVGVMAERHKKIKNHQLVRNVLLYQKLFLKDDDYEKYKRALLFLINYNFNKIFNLVSVKDLSDRCFVVTYCFKGKKLYIISNKDVLLAEQGIPYNDSNAELTFVNENGNYTFIKAKEIPNIVDEFINN